MNQDDESLQSKGQLFKTLGKPNNSTATLNGFSINRCISEFIGSRQFKYSHHQPLKHRYTITMTQGMNCNESTDGVEYELTEFLLMATQDELNAANALQTKLDADKRFMNLFDDTIHATRSNSPDTTSDTSDIAGDAIDVALSASSFVAGWINRPGCHGGDYGRSITPNNIENEEAAQQALIEKQLQGIEGVLSWRDVITDQILVGLGLRQSKVEGNDVGEEVSRPEDLEIDGATDRSQTPTESTKASPSDVGTNVEDDKVDNSNVSEECAQDVSAEDGRDDSNAPREITSTAIEPGSSERTVSSNNDVVKELVVKCLNTNKSNPTAKAVSHDARDDISVPRDINIVAPIDKPGKPGESKNDVVKKLVAKCLAMNKKASGQSSRLQIEPDSYPSMSPRTEVQPSNNAYAINANVQLEPEVNDPSIDSSVGRDPPETHETRQLTPTRPIHVKWNTSNTVMAVKALNQPEQTNPKPEDNSMTLKIESTGRAPSYYAQPPRPETPFHTHHAGEDITRCLKKLRKSASSSFRHVNKEVKAEEPKSTPFKESVLSSSAVLRRRHYKEMLIKERAAKAAVIE
jgi:hypothetical protein